MHEEKEKKSNFLDPINLFLASVRLSTTCVCVCLYVCFCVNSRVKREINSIGNLILPFSTARFLLPATELTRYDTLVETVYSSLDEGVFGWGDATRFDFDDAAVSCSDFLLLGSLTLSGSGSAELSGEDVGSALLEGSGSGSADVSGDGVGSALLFGSGSAEASGSLDGSAAAASYPESCNSGNFLHSAVNFFGLHPKPTHDVPFTVKTISISFCSFNILQ